MSPQRGISVASGNCTSTSLTPSVPLTKLLGGGGLTTVLLLLVLTTTGATPLCNSATSSTTASAASATSSASATTAAATAAEGRRSTHHATRSRSTSTTGDVDARGMASGATTRHTPGREPGGAEPVGVELEGAEPGVTESEGAEFGGAEPRGNALSGGPAGASPQQLREWFVWRPRLRSGATGAGGAGDARAVGAGVTAGAGGARGTAATGPGGAGTGGVEGAGAGDPTEPGAAGYGGTGTGGAGAGGTGAAGAGAVDPAAGGAGDTVRPRPYFVPLIQQVLGVPSSTSLTPPFLCPQPDHTQLPLQPASPLPAPSPYTEQSDSLIERREPVSHLVSHVCTACRFPRSRPPPVPGTHVMALRPSSVPLRVPLPAPSESSLPVVPDSASDRARAASPTVSCLLVIAVTDPSFESVAASTLVAELLDCAAACRLYYATALLAESESSSPPFIGGECALGTDVLEDRKEDFECLAATIPRFASMLLAPEGDPDAPDIPTPRSYVDAITGPYSSQWHAAMDAEMASWKSRGTYVDEVPPPGANIVDGMWIFRVKRPPGSLPAFKARYVARGFSHQQGVNYFQIFSPTPKMTTLWVLLHVAAQRDYELHSLDFSTAFLQGILYEEIWLRRPPGFTESFPAGTQWSLWRPVYGLRQAPREWHDTLRTTLAALGFAPSTADPLLFLRTDTSLPPFYVLMYVDDLVFATTNTEALTLAKSELQKRHTCTDLGEVRSYLGLHITRDRARRTITLTQSHMLHQVLQRFGFHFSSPQPTPLSISHSLSAPPSDESVEPTGPYAKLVGCLMYLMTCTRPDFAYPLSLLARYVAPGRHQKVHWDVAKRVLCYLCSTSGMGLVLGGRGPVVLTGHADASWVDGSATQRSSQGYSFSLGSGSVLWQSTCSSLVLSSSCEAEIYAGAMATQELRWLTYLLTDLGEQPRSPRVLYVDNKAMIALCQEHRLEHRMKHIALRYFLARELRQCGQLRLVYVATRANTADIFTKALPPEQVMFQDRFFFSHHIALLHSSRRPALPVASPCPACRVALLAATPPCPACASPCPAHTEPPYFPHHPAARRPAAARPAGRRPAGSCTAARTALPVPPCCCPPCCAQPCWPAPCCLCAALLAAAPLPAPPCPSHPAAAHPVVRRPAGRRPAARAPHCCSRAALLAAATPCPAYVPPCPALAAPHYSLAFDTWLDDLQLYLLSDSRDSVSLFDHTSRASLAPPTTADSATRSQWLTRDAVACLAVRNHLPLAERAHFGQHKTAKALYDTVVARYSSPATAALSRLITPYLFPELDHFLALGPTDLTVDLLEKHLLAAETSIVAVCAARGTPRTPFFEERSPSPHAPSYVSAAAADILGTEDIGTASALSGKRHSSKGKGGKSGGVAAGVVVVEAVEAVEVAEVVAGVGASVVAVVAAVGVGVAVVVAVGVVEAALVVVGVELLRGEVLAVARGSSSSVEARPLHPSSFVSGLFSVGRLGTERPRWLELLRSGVDVIALDYDAILAAMYALSVSAEGGCHLSVPLDPGIEAAALGASESTLPSTAPVEALHTFTLDSGASRCFFCDSTTLTPLPAPATVRLADPSGGLVLAHSSTVLPCPARVLICTCTRTGRHLAKFARRRGSSLYTLSIEPPQVASSAQVSASSLVAAPCSCHLLSHQTLMWHHRLGHPSLPRLCGMHSRLLVSGLPSKGEVPDVLVPWIPAIRLQLRERFRQDHPVQRLHSDRGGEFSSDCEETGMNELAM
ncbi:unnamed protein product, partial [Closterium sp. NIES-54]